MVTQAEETQAKEFLKRAEIRTMRKDLLILREGDALKERDKIVQIKTLEELIAPQKNVGKNEMEGLKEVLQKNENQEKIAEKDLKNFANEQERQQMFLLESQRFGFEKQADEIDQKKDPELKLEKNKLLLQKRDLQTKLNSILEKEKKLEDEQKFISEKSQTTTIPAEKKSLEQRRWDIDKEIQDIEKKRWEVEKQIEDADAKVGQTDKLSESLVQEKNQLSDKIMGINKSLREIYSGVVAREEEKRSGKTKEQLAQREILSKARAEEKENVQRQQRIQIPVPSKEEEQRKKFLQDVEQANNIK